MLQLIGLVGLVLVGVAAFRLGRDPGERSNLVIAGGVVGLLASLVLGVLPPLLVASALALIGRGLRPGDRRLLPAVVGAGILAVPFGLGGLFYLASLAA